MLETVISHAPDEALPQTKMGNLVYGEFADDTSPDWTVMERS